MTWIDLLPVFIIVVWAADGVTLLGREDGKVVVKKYPFEFTERLLRGIHSRLRAYNESEDSV